MRRALLLIWPLAAACATASGGAAVDGAEMPVCPGVAEGRFATMAGPGERPDTTRANPVLEHGRPAPRLLNALEVRRALVQSYPAALHGAGISGEVEVTLRITETGAVQGERVSRGSGEAALDQAALVVVRTMRFAPAVLNGCRIPVVLRLPVTFNAMG